MNGKANQRLRIASQIKLLDNIREFQWRISSKSHLLIAHRRKWKERKESESESESERKRKKEKKEKWEMRNEKWEMKPKSMNVKFNENLESTIWEFIHSFIHSFGIRIITIKWIIFSDWLDIGRRIGHAFFFSLSFFSWCKMK